GTPPRGHADRRSQPGRLALVPVSPRSAGIWIRLFSQRRPQFVLRRAKLERGPCLRRGHPWIVRTSRRTLPFYRDPRARWRTNHLPATFWALAAQQPKLVLLHSRLLQLPCV